MPVEAYLGGADRGDGAIDPDSALVLIHAEYLLRQELGLRHPGLEEYLARSSPSSPEATARQPVHGVPPASAGEPPGRRPERVSWPPKVLPGIRRLRAARADRPRAAWASSTGPASGARTASSP